MPAVHAEPEAQSKELAVAPRVGVPPATDSVSQVLRLQRAIGNRATTRLLQREATAERELDKRWQVPPAAVDDPLAKQLLALKSITLTFWVNYDAKTQNNAEFQNAATDFAKTYKTLGLSGTDADGARLKLGTPIEVASRGDIIQAIASVAQTVHRLHFALPAPADGAAPADEPRIETVAIFCHGEPFGLGIDPKNANYTKAKDLKTFVGAIRSQLAGNVRFLLYACSAGAATDEVINQTKADTGSGGKGSFAQLLAEELGGDAEVFAHEIAGNVASNPYARRFTAKSDTGQSMFDTLYGEAFVQSEMKRLRAEKAGAVAGLDDAKLAAKLRGAMWHHYVFGVSTDFVAILTRSRHFGIGGYGGIGGAMFMDPTGTAAVLRQDFQTYWLDDDTLANDFARKPAQKPPVKTGG